VQLVWNPGHPLWPIRMDPSQIDQILANLAANARDAIAGVGRVTISTANVTVTAADRNDRAWFTPGDYVLLRVGDDGSGMDEDTRSHIFEPFFTTKPAGQGTGLGLATVYGIVRQNEGMIDLTTKLGEGTTVAIYLRRFAGDKAAFDAGDPDAAPEQGQETVLLVEDEPMMLELSRTMLEKLGYRVLPAATPAAAIALADRYAGQIDVLFTDVVMPSMSGDDLAARLVQTYPNLKCLFASGHFTHGLARGGAINEGVHFLQKPFSLADLAAKLREVLEPGA
jgi:two-component system cell cycle sensor histidine kinase/response regulator CckA